MSTELRVNPFQVGIPIQDPAYFAGRQAELAKLSRDLLRLQNISLRGERRTGKTSLLLYLAHPDAAAAIGLPENHIPVYLDFQGLVQTKAINVWGAIAEAVAKQIKQRRPDCQTIAEQFLKIIDEGLNTPDLPEAPATKFGDALTTLISTDLKIHLLFDEFEQTQKNPELDDAFYDALRSLIIRSRNVSYVIATRTGLAALQSEHTQISSPFFNIFTGITLLPFEEGEVRRMLINYVMRTGAELSLAEKLHAELPFLYEITGYHPFFLQLLCSHLFTQIYNPDLSIDQARDEALRAFTKDAEDHFSYYWDVSSGLEVDLLKRMATNQTVESAQLETLINRCLVVQSSDEKAKWQLFSSVFRDWINRKLDLKVREAQSLYDRALQLIEQKQWTKAIAILDDLKEELGQSLKDTPSYNLLRDQVVESQTWLAQEEMQRKEIFSRELPKADEAFAKGRPVEAQRILLDLREHYPGYKEKEINDRLTEIEQVLKSGRLMAILRIIYLTTPIALMIIITAIFQNQIAGIGDKFLTFFLASPTPTRYIANIDRIDVFLNGSQLDLGTLPILTGGQAVELDITASDSNGNKYTSDDLVCKWSVTPSNEDGGIETDLCKTLFIPSHEYPHQTIIIDIQGLNQQFSSIEPILLEFNISQ